MNDTLKVNLRDVRRRFDRAASTFDSADFVHAVTREGLFARLEPLVVDPNTILDLGCATGSATHQLRKRFRRAHLVSLDISHGMLRQAVGKRPRFSFSRYSEVQANAVSLPIKDQSIDFVFSNLLLPCTDSPDLVFQEVARVLKKGGVFAFASLGPDSLLEISRAWSRLDGCAHVNRFPDMHDIGDALVRSGLRDPVLDVDRLTVSYDNAEKLFADLTDVGARNALQQRNRSLVGKHRFREMQRALAGGEGDTGIGLELELVYGHCWGGGARLDPSYHRVDASRIPRRRR
ncbi:MAG: methyltransferase domain-containing protein [Gammaproteobacteria bacterium]|nr:methyltransferase domain-containing protein [Gammaproteobacteria bacterium]NND46255.1 methyltransferase domain-containing protein [Woeseiaceae bacterium]